MSHARYHIDDVFDIMATLLDDNAAPTRALEGRTTSDP